jgi:prevent-host-death family protein
MSTVGVKELKNRLTQYLRRTKQGEEIVVTERGRPVAVIQPIESARTILSLDAKLARLAAQGRVSLPTRAPLKRVRLVRLRGPRIAQTVVEDRR